MLAYHRFGGSTTVSVDLPVRQIAEQLDTLGEIARVVSIDVAVEELLPGAGNGRKPDRHRRPDTPTVVITADDGTSDWVEVLLPLLVARNLPMTWYVATAFVDEQRDFPHGGRPITWSALRDAASTGLITVASHTHSHAVMSKLDARTAATELDRSIDRIETEIGQPCRHFAYPKALSASIEAEREVRRRFRSAALAGNRVNIPGRTDPARLGRTPIKRSDSAHRFASKVRGGGRSEGWLREHYDRFRYHDDVT